ncbi:MAG: glycosyltransferase family 39 protein, partial [Anaerolineales bacterium]
MSSAPASRAHQPISNTSAARSTGLQSPVPLLVLILLVGAALRFHALDKIPPGMTHDEASVGFFVRQVAERTGFRIDVPYGYANEPLTKYAAAPLFWALGARDWTLRAHQAYWGVLAVALAFVWGRAAFGRHVGLATAALQAVLYWPVATSRMALNSNPLPAFATASAYFLWKGARADTASKLRWYGIGLGVAVALSLFTYEAARTTWAAYPAFLAFAALFSWGRARNLWTMATALAAGTAVALPHLMSPAAWGRTSTLATPLAAARAGDFTQLLENALAGLGTLVRTGDPFVVYNLPGRPVFGAVLAVLFVAGVLVSAWRWRSPTSALALLWLGAALVPTLVIGAFTATLHSIAAQVVVVTFPAIAVSALIARARAGAFSAPDVRSLVARYGWSLLAVGIIVAGIGSARDYFGRWAQSGEMRAAYFANFGAVTRYLDNLDRSSSVTLSSAFPDLPHDPLTYAMRVHRPDLDVRWFDAREAMVFPAAAESVLILPVQAYPDPVFAARLPLSRAERIVVRPDDIDPWFDVLVWEPQTMLSRWLREPDVIKSTGEDWQFGIADSPAIRLVAYAHSEYADRVVVLTFWQ